MLPSPGVKVNEREKRDKYVDLARELKRTMENEESMKPLVNGALGTIRKGLLKGLEELENRGKEENIQSTVLLRSARILRRVLET